MMITGVIFSIILVIGLSIEGILAADKRSTVSIAPLKKDLKPDDPNNQRDPTPEFYRGSSLDRERFSNVIGRNGFENDKSNFITSPGGTRFTPSAPAPTPPPYNNRDRLGNEGTPYSGSSRYGYGGGYGNTGPSGNGYGYLPGGTYEPSPPPYGPPQPVDPSYNLIQDGGYGEGGYENGLASHFGGHHGHDLTKKVLLPLAGAAILGVAAALVANPVLLQLGVTSAGKRKRRDVDTNNAQILAYNGHQN